jgi:hypothetical protein
MHVVSRDLTEDQVVTKEGVPSGDNGRFSPDGGQVLSDVVCVPTLEELRKYVHLKLCEPDHLDPAQTPLFQANITRQGKLCGLFFQVNGPRQLTNHAVWAGAVVALAIVSANLLVARNAAEAKEREALKQADTARAL